MESVVARGRGGFAAYGYADEAQDHSGRLSRAERNWYTWFFLNVEAAVDYKLRPGVVGRTLMRANLMQLMDRADR